MVAEQDRERLRATFDAAVDRYHRARPDYPDVLFDDLLEHAGLRAGDHVLEIGCATGKATVGLVARGLRVTCVELGEHLAAAARRNLGDAADVITGAFEEVTLRAGAYDLVAAATAWHWVDPAARCVRAAEVLRDGGHLAIWGAGHVIPVGGDPFFEEIQEIYVEIGEGLPPGAPLIIRPEEVEDACEELQASGLFDVVLVRRYDWETVHDAESYIDLLNTFSGHIAMQPWQRDRLYGEIRRRLALRPDGLLRRHWGGALTIGRKR